MATSVVITRRPSCDIHKFTFEMPDIPAFFDAKTSVNSPGRGRWANMCLTCYNKYGMGLGTGLGQRLILKGEGDK